MGCPVTGYRGRGATTKMRCVDVAALFAAAILRRNPDSVVIPFDTRAYGVRVDPGRSEEHTSELQSHSEISYAVFCLKKKKKKEKNKILSYTQQKKKKNQS